MTKRQAVREIPATDLLLLADAAAEGLKKLNTSEARKVKRAIKVLRKVKAAKEE